jgi:hypothetical protein
VTADPYERLLRWYPPQWRERYGDEMTALLQDRYANAADMARRDRWGLVRSGVAERARATGLIGSHENAAERLRSGSVLVLCGWALFLVALAIFGKATDNWLTGTPRSGRWLAVSGFDALTVAAAAGCALVLAAALCALPAFGRLLRNDGWSSVRGPVSRAVVSAAVALTLFGGAVTWAHHLSRRDRNGGLLAYSILFMVISLAAVVAIGCATAAAIAVARRIDLPVRSLRALGLMASGLCGLMVLVAAGFTAWWAAEALHAPRVLAQSIGNGLPFSSSTIPPGLLAAGLLMAAGLVLALAGTGRMVRVLGTGRAPV